MHQHPIIPSLLAANILTLDAEIQRLKTHDIHRLHIDIMDNHYVPNLTFGPHLCAAIHQQHMDLILDVHLMASPVDTLIQQLASAGAARISIHPDASIHLDRSLALIKNQNMQAGLVLNPSTSPDIVSWCLHRLDFILIMTVNPGFSGQNLINAVIPKINYIHTHFPELLICVDGGITLDNIAILAKAGAQEFVVGSALFNTQDYAKTLEHFAQVLHDS